MPKIAREETEALERLLKKKRGKKKEKEEGEEKKKREEREEEISFIPSATIERKAPILPVAETQERGLERELAGVPATEREREDERAQRGGRERGKEGEPIKYGPALYEPEERRDTIASIDDMRRLKRFIHRRPTIGEMTLLDRPRVEMPMHEGMPHEENIEKYVADVEPVDPWKKEGLGFERPELKKYRKRV